MNCFQAKAGQLTPQWYVIDATDKVVGRLAAQIAPILMGKHRPTYTAHIDTGDYVIVTNVEKVVFTGKKWEQKTYQRYSGWPGGQKDEVAWKLFKRHPERILHLAIQRMMPKNKIGRHMLGKLKLCVGSQHPHQAQGPIPLTPLSGRPESAGALWTPEPKPKAPRAPRPVAPVVEPPAVEPSAPPPTADVPVTEASAPTPETPAVEAQLPAPEPMPRLEAAPEPSPLAEALAVEPPAPVAEAPIFEAPDLVATIEETPAVETPLPAPEMNPPPDAAPEPTPPLEAPAPTSRPEGPPPEAQ